MKTKFISCSIADENNNFPYDFSKDLSDSWLDIYSRRLAYCLMQDYVCEQLGDKALAADGRFSDDAQAMAKSISGDALNATKTLVENGGLSGKIVAPMCGGFYAFDADRSVLSVSRGDEPYPESFLLADVRDGVRKLSLGMSEDGLEISLDRADFDGIEPEDNTRLFESIDDLRKYREASSDKAAMDEFCDKAASGWSAAGKGAGKSRDSKLAGFKADLENDTAEDDRQIESGDVEFKP